MDRLSHFYREENLKEISRRLISAYGNRNGVLLKRYARWAGIKMENDGQGRLFKKLITLFHPDRASHYALLIDRLRREKRDGALERLAYPLRCSPPVDEPASESREEFPGPYGEWETYDPSDYSDHLEGDLLYEREANQWGFIEAVRNLMYGNLFSDFLPKDLLYLDGFLDLPESDIEDLTGLEYCTGLTGLNLERNRISRLGNLEDLTALTELYLSGNRINSAESLSGLTNLETLDLSYNEIEDPSPLLFLHRLKYLNLTGNPLYESAVLSELGERCLVVL